ncbi:MAG: hormogonium polysaccharide biosynthesis protein HpsA [Plectolyngbya sp. WJT66-NPBG17]|jgi:hypothetical protein|nr:hormogonium polysaccharide biosynthesis protein HpsA [Plectolyngbya sp. WJT66-NPBG17]
MSNRKLSLQGFFHKLGSLYRKITKSSVNSVLRYVLLYQRRGKLSTAGFILPTTVLLILVVALTVGALTFRAYNRNIQVIGDAQQRVIYNAATPAIDRARSKLEFLFDSTKDTRLPSGVPSQVTLEAMLLNDRNGDGKFPALPYKNAAGNQTDAYTFPDETPIDINGGGLDNAWYFRTDTNGDGTIDDRDATTVYSIVLKTPPAVDKSSNNPAAKTIATTLLTTKDTDKAKNLWVRQAPLSVDGALGCATNSSGGNAGPDGWFEDKTSTAILRKNFQVDALVIPGSSGGTKATLEFTQDRQLDRGNKWGAWFRHDLEIYPGATFNWNGAMHTEGSLIVGNNKFTAYLISSPSSCLYNPPSNSEITVTNVQGGTEKKDLLGLVAAGVVRFGEVRNDDKASIHLHSSNPVSNSVELNRNTASSAATNPIDITIDPETVLLDNGYTNLPPASGSPRTDRNNRGANRKTDANGSLAAFGKNQGLPQRIDAKSESAPYVDDLYRADDRWGPKAEYKSTKVATSDFGKQIPSTNLDLINNTVSPGDPEGAGVGLDGYWERRARVRGLRILVGQRLELGNLFTWYAPQNKDTNPDYVANDSADVDQAAYEHEGDPLYPVTVKPYPVTPTGRLSHVDLQRRTLRDNLSAVQSTAIYHASADDQKDYPIACLATTSHPGTFWTLRQAITFRPFNFAGTDDSGAIDPNPSLLTNFFTGVGTNGWEFAPPAGDYATFKGQIEDASSPLRKALQNLANFAGDHQGSLKSGAFPPTPNDSVIHPYPALSMWGDYSNLKRALSNLGTNFDNLSVADKTYIQTAACTLGMLAYNIDQIQKFDPSAISGSDAASNAANDRELLPRSSTKTKRLMARLGRDLWLLMDGRNDGPTSDNPEVLSREQLKTYNYSASGYPPTGSPSRNDRLSEYNPEDYRNVTPEALIAALRQYLLAKGTAADGTRLKPDHPQFIDEMRMAEMIMLNHQIRRDRTFGFKPSPRFGEYRVSVSGRLQPDSMATACDPDQFVFTNGTEADTDFITLMRSDRILSKASTALTSSGLNAVPLPSNPADYTKFFPEPEDRTNNGKRELSQYRFALSKLCGTLDASGTAVLPKFPALYYLFPEVAHDYKGARSVGGYDHQQPSNEPYIADNYVASINASFEPISTTLATGRAKYPSAVFSIPASDAAYDQLSRKPDLDPTKSTRESVRVFPIPDYSVSSIALTPRNLDQWQLPKLDPPKPYVTASPLDPNSQDKANFSPNIILADSNLKPIAVPFLDRAFFDGRQLMLARTLDIDLGMLRSTRLGSKNDTWLPVSGIVYAFREDAVREDAISRPPCTGTNCEMDLRDPANPVDPRVKPANSTNPTLNAGENGISTKAIDKYPDPDRRIHGFRLRNGVQLMRNRKFEAGGSDNFMDKADNSKGLSLFTDQPVYIEGDFNLHQTGDDDTMGTILEEFKEALPSNYNATEFYIARKTLNTDTFATLDKDRWRPSEILADSISVLSNGFCDGTIADVFLQYQKDPIIQAFSNDPSKRYPIPDGRMIRLISMTDASGDRNYYHEVSGLFDPGCVAAEYTSFHNQNRPARQMNGKTAGNKDGWDWVRENSRYDAIASRRSDQGGADSTGHWVDITSPIKISRAGQPLVVRPRDATVDDNSSVMRGKVRPPVPYNVAVSPDPAYYNYGNDVDGDNNLNANYGGNRDNNLIRALSSRINSIIVSGISPSRPKQGYGGLHNFPRFLEFWQGKDLSFSGSFIQLSYTNYATSPFELENIEPWSGTKMPSDPEKENIVYYQPPTRRWGYDVALQFSPAGPAAARFVTQGKDRSEYYVEPPANDPYIANLCQAVKKLPLGLNTNCPTPKP